MSNNPPALPGDFYCGIDGKGERKIVVALPNKWIVTYNFGKIY